MSSSSSSAPADGRGAIRRVNGALTDRDYIQLLHHEAHIHVATSLNGKAQHDLPLLAAGHPDPAPAPEGLHRLLCETAATTRYADRQRLERNRLAEECAKLDPAFERAMADEGVSEELNAWPRY